MNDAAHLRRALGASLLAALAGCAVGPAFVAPAPPQEQRYTAADPVSLPLADGSAVQTVRAGSAVPQRWWQAFGSPGLNELIELALAGSPTLETARATLAQAEQTVSTARGAAYPQLTLAASVARGSGNAARGSSGFNQISVGPSLSYPTDLFGGIAHRIEQAEALAEFQQAQWAAAYLALTGNTVLQAIALASANEQIAAAQDIVAVDQRNLELVQLSHEAGKSARLDVLTAQSQLASDRALLPPLLQQASVARHALAVLAGRTSAEWSPPAFDLKVLALPQTVPLALPSELVRRRPDIVAAQAQLHAANAAIGIATAQLYPSVTLNASWTSAAANAGDLFSSRSNVWNIAAGLLAPIFDGHTLAAQRAAATEAYAAQLGSYRQTVLLAFGQVADVLEALRNDTALLDAQGKALATALTTLDLTQQSYQAGQTSLLQLLEAQRLYQQARLGHARATAQRHADTAQLFIAMGGAAPKVEQVRPSAR